MKPHFTVINLVVASLCFAQRPQPEAVKVRALQATLDLSLHDYQLYQLDNRTWLTQIQRGEPITLDLNGLAVEAKLVPHNLRARDFLAVTVAENGEEVPVFRPVSTYRGNLLGFPDSDLRLTVTDRLISGTVTLEGEVFFLQPAAKFDAAMGSEITVVYRDTDVREEAQAFCGMRYHQEASEKIIRSMKAGANPRVVQIALDTDGEFYQNHSSVDVHSLLEGFVNQLDAIWRNDLDLQLEITRIFVRTNPNTDPWSSTIYGHGPNRFGPFFGGGTCLTPGDGLWEQFRNFWNASTANFSRDIMVLFVGRDMKLCPTSSSGEAELFGTAGDLGTICEHPDRAYVVMEEYPTNTAGLMAHEIGHSLNGVHIFDPICDPGLPIGPVLCGTVEAGSDYYDPSNITRIGNFVGANNDCLGEEVEFTIVADSYTLPNWPNNNYGSNTRVFMRTGESGYARNGYFKFTVSGITDGVSSAKMRVKTGPVAFPHLYVYQVNDSSWGEFTITWNNAPAFGKSLGDLGPLPANSWVDIDVSAIITGNGTFTIGINAPDIPNLYFRSRQTAEKPKLIVFTDP